MNSIWALTILFGMTIGHSVPKIDPAIKIDDSTLALAAPIQKVLAESFKTVLKLDEAISDVIVKVNHVLEVENPEFLPKLEKIFNQTLVNATPIVQEILLILPGSNPDEKVKLEEDLTKLETVLYEGYSQLLVVADEAGVTPKIRNLIGDLYVKATELEQPLLDLVSNSPSVIMSFKLIKTQVAVIAKEMYGSLIKAEEKVDQVLEGHEEVRVEVTNVLKTGVNEVERRVMEVIKKSVDASTPKEKLAPLFQNLLVDVESIGIRSNAEIMQIVEGALGSGKSQELKEIVTNLGTEWKTLLLPLSTFVSSMTN